MIQRFDTAQPGLAPVNHSAGPPDIVTLTGAADAAIVNAFADRRGALSCKPMNRDLVTFAKSSKVVAPMTGAGEGLEAIRADILRSRFQRLTGNPSLADAQIAAIVEMLDEVSPRGVFTTLNDELRRMRAH